MLSQCTNEGKGYGATNGVEITRARLNIATWHSRRGVAMDAKVALKGQHVDVRLPQLIRRICPPASTLVIRAPILREKSTSMTNGEVSCGFGSAVLEPTLELFAWI